MRIGLFGRGRLGQAILTAAEARGDVEVAWVADAAEAPGSGADVAIDASVAAAIPEHLAWAAASGTPIAIGATGWDKALLTPDIGGRTGVLVASNFSLTVALFARFAAILGRYTDLDATRDPYVFEHHHRLKADAPSGTAITLADAVLAGSARKRSWTLGTPADDELAVSVLRAGSEFGLHTVGFDSPAETFALTHQARSRAPFAEGALTAAAWLRGRTGLFTMADLAADLLDPLFSKENPS